MIILTKLSFLLIFISISLVSCNIGSDMGITKIGKMSNMFNDIDNRLSFDVDFLMNKKRDKTKEEYIILEYSWTYAWKYEYILIDLKMDTIEFKIRQEKSKVKLGTEQIINLKKKLSLLSIKNNIYDGSGFTLDGTIYIVRYYKGNLKNKFGLYGHNTSDLYDGEKELKQERQLNLEIINAIFDLVRKQENVRT
jgi:hypothetical protein